MIPILDLKAQASLYKQTVLERIEHIIDNQSFIMGSYVETFEKNLAQYLNVKKVVGVSSGTDALLVALMALGVKAGDEVIVPTFSFFATAGAVARLGAIPIFVDVDLDTFTMNKEQCKNAINEKTKAIIPVHLFGQICDLGELYNNPNIPPIIEDTAQAIGASLKDKQTGQLGHIAATSFFPSKNLGGFGDGGAVYGMDEQILEKCSILRVHGAKTKYHHLYVGGNFRLDAIQAAILDVKLEFLNKWTNNRQEVARTYKMLLAQTKLIQEQLISPQRNLEQSVHVFNQFTIRAKNRDALKSFLYQKGIETAIYYPSTLHEQPCFQYLNYKKGQLPNAETLCQETLSLPISPTLTIQEIQYIVDQIEAFYKLK